MKRKLKLLTRSFLLAAALFSQTRPLQAQTLSPQTVVDARNTWQYDYLPGGLDRATDYNGDGMADDWTAFSANMADNFTPVSGHFSASGRSPLGYGDSQRTVLTYADATNKPITAYFRTVGTLAANTNPIFSATLQLRVDDGCVVYVNGNEVYRRNLPAGSVGPSDRASADVPQANEATFSLVNIPPEVLQVGPNVVACEVHQFSATSDDLAWEATLVVNYQNPQPTGSVEGISQTPENPAAGSPVMLGIVNPKDIPAGAVYDWLLDGRVVQSGDRPTLEIPMIGSESTGEYRLIISTGNQVFDPSRDPVVCTWPPRLNSDDRTHIYGTIGEDIIVVTLVPDAVRVRIKDRPEEYVDIPYKSALDFQGATIDLGPGNDTAEVDLPYNVAEKIRFIGGGQAGDMLIYSEYKALVARRNLAGWAMIGDKQVTGSLKCVRDAPLGCAPLTFTLNPPVPSSSYPVTWTTNASGNFAGVLPMVPGGTGSVVFNETIFNIADWNKTTVVNAAGAASTTVATPLATGGNPTNYYSIGNSLIVSGSGGVVTGIHLRNGAVYSPSSQGAITTINYSESSKNFINQSGDGQGSGVAILQSGKYFIQRTPVLVMPFSSHSEWKANSALGLNAAAFQELTPAGILVPTSQPNFSATATPLQFGFWRGNSGNGNIATNCGIDNWRVEIVSQRPYSGLLEVSSPICPDQKWSFNITDGILPTALGTLLCNSCPVCVCPPPNMTLWLPMDENTGLTTANRSSAGYPGTHDLSSPLFQSGFVANSRTFGAAANRVKVPHYAGLDPGTGDFSMDCWVRRNSGVNTTQAILDHRANGIGWHLALSYGNPILQMANSTVGYRNYRATGTVPNDDCWHLVAVTVERANAASGIKFYIDGNLAGTASPTPFVAQSLNTATPLYVGASANAGNIPFQGSIDEVEFFNSRALTDAEVMSLYRAFNAGKCKCDGGWKTLALFNTGVNHAGVVLPDGSTDLHYTENTGAAAPTQIRSAFAGWVANSTASKWITKPNASSAAANYVYRQSIDLTGFDLSSVVISGRWACDNSGSVRINNTLVAGATTASPRGDQAWKPFTISSGFTNGINIIEYRVTNDGSVTGMISEISGRGYKCCPCDRVLAKLPLRNTGVNGLGAILADGAVDPFYTVTPGPTTYAVIGAGVWLPNSAVSKWIGVTPNGGSLIPTVNFTYKQTFNLSGYEVPGAQITGRYTADDAVDVYFINTLVTTATVGYSGWNPLAITTGFLPGLNTLEFRVRDLGFAVTGLRAEIAGTAYRCRPARWYYDGWAEEQSANPLIFAALSDSSGDYDGDGFTNGNEYAFGTDPQSTSYVGHVSLIKRQVAIPGLQGTWPMISGKMRRPLDRAGTYSGEASCDLVNWRPCTLISSEILPDGTTVEETYEDSDITAEEAATGKCFIRVKSE